MAAYEEWQKKPLPRLVTGHDLLALGFSEGPSIGKVLEDIREKHIAGELAEREEALSYARDQVNKQVTEREEERKMG